MKNLTLALLLISALPLTAQQVLTPSDREALLEQLAKIREEAQSKAETRFGTAATAFKRAASSPSAALELYLRCEEMVNFEEMKKKTLDFREWKRNNDSKLSDVGFQLALQQQLRWLLLTLEAASDKPAPDKLAIEATHIIDALISKAEDLSPYRQILEQDVTTSVFARAYDINGLKVVKDWPLAPTPLAKVYDQVLLPPLRRADRIESLKATWMKRMVNEGALLEALSTDPEEKSKPGIRSAEYEKFVSETVPTLRWDAEVDLFKAGDEQGAAIRMLKHIEENLNHQSAAKWGEDFLKLLEPQDSAKNDP
jgi:hypothetical protein